MLLTLPHFLRPHPRLQVSVFFAFSKLHQPRANGRTSGSSSCSKMDRIVLAPEQKQEKTMNDAPDTTRTRHALERPA
ncbi:hypothetical protein [Massilia suwonensis]|uniref:Secreted protein n=1 Tax=Massilia suwonensis TaxID=648895 RepID=A0ABW0MGS5_9BURK